MKMKMVCPGLDIHDQRLPAVMRVSMTRLRCIQEWETRGKGEMVDPAPIGVAAVVHVTRARASKRTWMVLFVAVVPAQTRQLVANASGTAFLSISRIERYSVAIYASAV